MTMSDAAKTNSPTRSRFSRSLLGEGSEPDPRFTLANERTFLAWIRTALAFIAGGIAVQAFADDVFSDTLRQFVATSLLVLAMLISATAGARWLGVERAMRQHKPLPVPWLVPVLSLGGALVAAGFIGFLFWRTL